MRYEIKQHEGRFVKIDLLLRKVSCIFSGLLKET